MNLCNPSAGGEGLTQEDSRTLLDSSLAETGELPVQRETLSQKVKTDVS